MPKPFQLLVAVEEVALGPVMAKLHQMPGVVKVDMLLGDTRAVKDHANGHANGHAQPKKPAKLPYKGDQTAEQFILKILKNKPLNAAAIQTAFESEGRAGGSYASAVWNAKNNGLVQQKQERGPYTLTKKGRDRARAV